jgi:hypothetical protein
MHPCELYTAMEKRSLVFSGSLLVVVFNLVVVFLSFVVVVVVVVFIVVVFVVESLLVSTVTRLVMYEVDNDFVVVPAAVVDVVEPTAGLTAAPHEFAPG